MGVCFCLDIFTNLFIHIIIINHYKTRLKVPVAHKAVVKIERDGCVAKYNVIINQFWPNFLCKSKMFYVNSLFIIMNEKKQQQVYRLPSEKF